MFPNRGQIWEYFRVMDPMAELHGLGDDASWSGYVEHIQAAADTFR